MTRQSLFRFVGLAALLVVAFGALGAALGGRNDDGAGSLRSAQDRLLGLPDAVGVEEPAAGLDADVMAQIDAALGRPFDGAQDGPSAVQSLPPVERDKGGLNKPPATRDEASGGSAEGHPGEPSGPLTSLDDRKIVQTASLRLQVKEVGASFEEAGRIATAAGGFVASSNFAYQGDPSTLRQGSGQAGSGQVQIASMTIRVPATRYQEVLGQLRALGVKVDAESSNASDVTEEYSDLSARLRNLEAAEAQLLALLSRAATIGEVLQVQDRLNGVRGEIEQVKGRMALLDKLSDLATITAHLRPEVVVAKVDARGTKLGDAVSEAWDASIEFLGGVAAVVLTGVVFLWWLPLAGAPAYGVTRLWLRGRPKPAEAAAQQ